MLRVLPFAFVTVVTAAVASVSVAATLLESKDDQGIISQTWFEGSTMRGQEQGAEEYVLFDAAKQKLYMVSPKDREVYDMSGFLGQSPSRSADAAKVDAKLTRQGAGPVIAGYSTDHYVLSANGNKCTDEYLSKKAMADLAAAAITSERFWRLGAEQGPPMPGMAADPCELVDLRLAKLYQQHGMPLRVVEPDGTVSMDVIRIVKSATAPSGGLSLPAGYQVIDMVKQMQDALGGIPPPAPQ